MSFVAAPTAPVNSTNDGGLAAAMQATLLGGEPAAPVTPAVVEPAPVAAPEPAAAPVAPVAPEPAAPTPAPVAPTEPKPGEVKLPFDDIKPPAEPEPTEPKDKQGYRIKELKEEISATWKPKVAALEETAKQREARLQELEATASEAEKLREQIKSYESEMSVVRLEKTRAFQTEVSEPLTQIEKSAGTIVETYGLDRDKVFEAIAEPDPVKRRAALREATSGVDIDQLDLVDLHNLSERAQPIFEQRDRLYANADQALAELGARAEQETAAQAMARAEERGKATDLVAARIIAKIPFMADLVHEVAPGVKGTNFEALDPQRHAYNAIAGDSLPKLVEQHIAVLAERDRLLDELASYQKASPRVGGGLTPTPAGGTPPKDLNEAMQRSMGFA